MASQIVSYNTLSSLQQASFEKRRIVGSLRERTVFIPTNFPHHFYSQEMNSFKANELTSEKKNNEQNISSIVEDVGEHVNQHVQQILESQLLSLEEQLDELDQQTQKNLETQEALEKELKQLKDRIKKKEIKKCFNNYSRQTQIPQTAPWMPRRNNYSIPIVSKRSIFDPL